MEDNLDYKKAFEIAISILGTFNHCCTYCYIRNICKPCDNKFKTCHDVLVEYIKAESSIINKQMDNNK